MTDSVPDYVDTARLALLASLCGIAVSLSSPTAAAGLWAVSAYLYVRYLGGRTETRLPWAWR